MNFNQVSQLLDGHISNIHGTQLVFAIRNMFFEPTLMTANVKGKLSYLFLSLDLKQDLDSKRLSILTNTYFTVTQKSG